MSDDSKSREISLESVLRLLDRWRHLPAYQLERRADVLFAMFLPEVLEKRFRAANLCLIPEFPIKKSLLQAYRNDTTSNSIKVDFLAVEKADDGEAPKRAFLVELKTDMASWKSEQERDLNDAASLGLRALVEGVMDIARATNETRKYGHLLSLMSYLGLIKSEEPLFPVSKKVLNEIDCKVTGDCCLKLVYVQPQVPANTIDFNAFAETIEQGGTDSVRQTFACYLRKWADEVAGDPDPKNWSQS